MAFAVTNDFTANTTAESAKVNTNFADIETELNAFPTSGTLADAAVSTTAKLADSIITTAKFATTAFYDTDTLAEDSATACASQQSIKAYVDSNPSWTDYSGGESTTLPNGLIIKMGEDTGGDGDQTVDFGTAFTNGIVSVVLTGIETTDAGLNVPYLQTTGTTGFTYYNPSSGYFNEGVSWIAIGY